MYVYCLLSFAIDLALNEGLMHVGNIIVLKLIFIISVFHNVCL